MPYHLNKTFTNGRTGQSWSRGRTLTDLPWLTDEQKQDCISRGDLTLVGEAPVVIVPDNLTLLDGINAEREDLLNRRGVLTFTDIMSNDITFLPHVGPKTADAIKRQAKELSGDAA